MTNLTKHEWDQVRAAGNDAYRANMQSPNDCEEAAGAKADEARDEMLEAIKASILGRPPLDAIEYLEG